MTKIGLVILNFLTYEDTLESIVTLNEMLVRNVDLNIYIVDNQTNIEKFQNFKDSLKNMSLDLKISYLESKENIGFSKGMNLGIDIARKNKCNYVVCSNSDIIYKKEINFNNLTETFDKCNKIGLIGPRITKNINENENPFYLKVKYNKNFISLIKQKIIYSSFLFFCLLSYLGSFISVFNKFLKEKNSQVIDYKNGEYYALHGSYFMLTPSYFKYYNNLDDNTFLYSEELIIAERLKKNNIVEYYNSSFEVFHHQASSTSKFIGSTGALHKLKRKHFFLKQQYTSRKYFLTTYVWNDLA